MLKLLVVPTKCLAVFVTENINATNGSNNIITVRRIIAVTSIIVAACLIVVTSIIVAAERIIIASLTIIVPSLITVARNATLNADNNVDHSIEVGIRGTGGDAKSSEHLIGSPNIKKLHGTPCGAVV